MGCHALIAAGLALFAFGDPAARWDGVALVRVQAPDAETRAAIEAIAEDVWTEGAAAAGGIDVAVSHERLGELELLAGDYELRAANLADAVEAELQRLATRTLAPPPQSGEPAPPDFFDDFRNLEELEGVWAQVAEALPELISREQIGVSYEGRKLWAFEISTAPPDAPAVFINFGQHAREWITPMSATWFLTQLVANYPEDNELQELFSQVRLYLVPLVNPDGYLYTWTDDRFWRKNRRPDEGVDLNRNWSVAWGEEPGSSSNPESGNYRGTGPFSEPETAALRAFMAGHDDLVAHADIHCYSQLVLYPLSYLSYEVPPLQGKARAWAELQAELMSGLYGTEYIPLRGSELYPATGVAMDWSFGALDIVSFTYELRPGTDIEFPDGFVLPPEEIIPTCEEASAGIYGLLQSAADGGPDPVEPPPPNPPPEPEDESGEAGGSEGGDGAGESGDDDDAAGELGTESGRPNGADEATSGCACSSSSSPTNAWGALLLVPLWWHRRTQPRRPSKA